MSVACENGCPRIVPLHLRLWSVKAPGYVSEGDEVQHVIMQVALVVKKRGALIAAVAYFAAARLGHQLKLCVLAEHIARVSKRMFDVREFFSYAIVDGLKWLFVSHGKWRGPCERFAGRGDLQMELEFADGYAEALAEDALRRREIRAKPRWALRPFGRGYEKRLESLPVDH